MTNLLRSSALLLLAAPVLAQLPAPSTVLRAAPRATWVKVTTAAYPSPTGTPAQAFRADNPGAASSDRLYVFGGSSGNNTTTTLNDLLSFDPVTATWTTHTVNGDPLSPHARGRASIAWNFSTNKLVVFGGTNRITGPLPTDTYFDDTWEWDPTTNVWTNVTPVSGSPSPRQYAGMAWDPTTGGMVLFGGQSSVATGSQVFADTWLLSGGVWTLQSPATVPPARNQASVMTRPDFGDVIMCCGADDSFATYPLDRIRHLDVWTWNGSNWTKISDWDWGTMTGTFPASALGTQATYDPIRKRIVVQGGNGITVSPTNPTFDYGTLYGGSPTNWTSEFDCITNTWTLYSRKGTDAAPTTAAFGDNDVLIGRISRSFNGFVASTGKIYKAYGQTSLSTTTGPLYVFSYQANPVAAAPIVGTGCTGSAGPLALSADNLPWTQRTFNATGTGFPAGSLGFAAIGWIPATTALSTLHPAGGAGCDLLVNPDVSFLLLPTAGTVNYSIAMPSDPVFAGAILTTQALCIELDPSFNLTAITSTNALAVTIGAL